VAFSKIKQVIMVSKPGVVTLKYPFEPRPAPKDFRGAPYWDHEKCIVVEDVQIIALQGQYL
jgi:hydrogenase-4 component H